MLRYMLIGYVVVYCLFAIFLFVAYARNVPEDTKKGDPAWETPLDVVLVVLGLAGMIFLVVDLHSTTVKNIWRFVSIALVAAQLHGNLKDRFTMLRSGEAKREEPELKYADLSTILFLLPSLCLNVYWAFR